MPRLTKNAFNVYLGDAGLDATYQNDFPKTTECCRCKGNARIGFVACEEPKNPIPKGTEFVCNLHKNIPKKSKITAHRADDASGDLGFWLHDCVAVAVYFCEDCMETTALYNQA